MSQHDTVIAQLEGKLDNETKLHTEVFYLSLMHKDVEHDTYLWVASSFKTS